ncbi:uncharacterized protein LOC124157139 [Ischnura elegans]|uniref:uncharacterized protein LOC124157139 n=1 Tax=Ischnura elegans TaxID=197161 RepID=UPI001ED876D2|nr:uncharacterized protein LOC124157139 [Ischnura elegans]
MELLSDFMEGHPMGQGFLKNFMLAWLHYERTNAPYEAPDLVKITGLLKAMGFAMTKVERMEGESWAPGKVNGCTVEIQCPVSKTKITLSSPEAVCHCDRGTANLGIANLNQSEMRMKIAMPEDLPPEEAMMVRICLSSLMSIIWRKADDSMPPNAMYMKRVQSLDSFREFEDDSGIESSSLLSIECKSQDSLISNSLTSLSTSLCSKSKMDSSLDTPLTTKSMEASSGKGKKSDPNLSLPTPKFQLKMPSPKSPYWESSTYRGKQYAEMVKQREAEKKKGK